MLRLLFVSSILLNLLLAGCATPSENTAAGHLQGQPLSALIKRVGTPDNQTSAGSRETYIWEHSEPVVITRGGEETAFTRITVKKTCRLTAETEGTNVIDKIAMDGNYEVCAFYRNKM
ncbi:hypothetical protein [Porticoccus sp.]